MAAIQKKKKDNKSFGLVLNEEVVEQARRYAKDNYNSSLSEIVRVLLDKFVEAEEQQEFKKSI